MAGVVVFWVAPFVTSGRRARHRRRDTGPLILGHDVDPTLMAWLFRPWCRHERINDRQSLLDGVHPPTDSDQKRVVVLARKGCRLWAPRQRTTRTRHLVGGHLLTVAGAAEDNAEAAWIGDGLQRGRDAERGVVVLGVIGKRTTVDGLVPGLRQMFDDGLLEFVSAVI